MNRTRQKNQQPILLTGMEHSGTTYLSNLLKCHPQIAGGFEGGMLLASQPNQFPSIEPFYKWMLKKPPVQWGLSQNDLNQICNSATWPEMYQKIRSSSPLFQNNEILLDKTPAYMPVLDQVMQKLDAKCVVIFKNTCYQYTSYKKRGFTLEGYIGHYMGYIKGLLTAFNKYHQRILIVNHNKLGGEKDRVLKSIIDFLGLEYNPAFWQDDLFTKDLPPNVLRADYDFNVEKNAGENLSAHEIEILQKYSQDELLNKISILPG